MKYSANVNRSAGQVMRKLLLAWLISVTIEYCVLPAALRDLNNLDGLAKMSLPRVCALTFGITLLLMILPCRRPIEKAERWAIMAAFSLLAMTALQASFTWSFFIACILLFSILCFYALFGRNDRPAADHKSVPGKKQHILIGTLLSILFFLFVSAWTVGRIYSFSTPTFDLGIFSQMFYNLKTSGLPMTTVERDRLLSHFAVHVSPIYYLLLPFYRLAPTPATLQVLQAAVITSSVLPLWKIGKHHGLTGAQRVLLCAALLLFPAYSGGTAYDIHENCFLAPLILWLLYGIDKRKPIITGISAVLTLTVKEDAAVYVAVIGLWLIMRTLTGVNRLDRHNLITGIVILTASTTYFFLVTGFLDRSGDGVMTSRYDNYMYDESSSLLTVIKSVILNPMKAMYECVDKEKLYFIAIILLPLLGQPLLTRRYERYILLIPYILVNLMSDYRYQHDIFYQYTFGSVALLFYLTTVNLAELRSNFIKSTALAASVSIAALCFLTVNLPKGIQYPIRAIQNYDYYQEIRDTMSTIPDDAAVSASTFYTTHLSQREILYDIRHCSREHILETEYIVLSLTSLNDYKKYESHGKDNGLENLIRMIENSGYTVYDAVENVLIIYRKTACFPYQ